MAEVKLMIDNEDSKGIFNNILNSLSPEQRVEAVAKFLESTYSSNKDYWGKSYLQSRTDVFIQENTRKYVEEHSTELQDKIKEACGFDTDKLNIVIKQSIDDVLSKLISDFISRTFLVSDGTSMVYNQVRDALAQKGIFL